MANRSSNSLAYDVLFVFRPNSNHSTLFILPRWMECRRGLAMKILSVRPSVCPSVRPTVTRVNCDKTVDRSVQIFTPYERPFSLVYWEEECLLGVTPCTWNFGSTGPRWSKFAYSETIIARSASAVTPSEKSSIIINRKSTMRFPMSPRRSSYVIPNSPKGWFENAVSEIWTISCDTPKQYEIGCQLLLITNKKSHTGFRLIPTSMTSNDLERRSSTYFAFFSTEFDRFPGRLYHSGGK